MSHTTHHDDCGCLTARYEARIAELEQREREFDKLHAVQVARVEILIGEKATLEAELAASRTDATLAWAEAKLIGEDEDAANLNAANWQAHANALRDALEWMRSHHSTTGTVLRRIEDALLATPAASLAAHDAEVWEKAWKCGHEAAFTKHDAEVLERGCAAMREVRIEHPPTLEDDDQGPFLHPSDIENLTRAIKFRALAAQAAPHSELEVKP